MFCAIPNAGHKASKSEKAPHSACADPRVLRSAISGRATEPSPSSSRPSPPADSGSGCAGLARISAICWLVTPSNKISPSCKTSTNRSRCPSDTDDRIFGPFRGSLRLQRRAQSPTPSAARPTRNSRTKPGSKLLRVVPTATCQNWLGSSEQS
jgi:hypothetical protein